MTISEDIRENFQATDCYQVLKIPFNSSQLEIKKAYLQRCLELHPDKINNEELKELYKKKFQTLVEIYKILSDGKTKEIYDSQIVNTCAEQLAKSTVSEDVPIEKCNDDKSCYYYDCRCSGSFVLDKNNFNILNDIDIFIVDCDSCSNSIRIVL